VCEVNEKQTRLGFSVGVFEGFRVRVVWILGMNRSFRAQESQMHAASKQREQQFGGLRTSVMKEKEEELALFLEMKKREKERNDLLLNSSEEFDAALGIDLCSFSFYGVEFYLFRICFVALSSELRRACEVVYMLVCHVV